MSDYRDRSPSPRRSRSRSRSPRRGADRGAEEPTTRLYIGNLSWGVKSEDLRSKFDKYGSIEDCYVATDRNTGRSRGYGFVVFMDLKDAEAAKDSLDGADMDGRPLRVNFARPRTEGGDRDGGFRGGRGGFRGGRGGFRDGGFRGGRGGGGFRGGRGGFRDDRRGGYDRDDRRGGDRDRY